MFEVIKGQAKAQAYQEVQNNSRFAMQKMSQLIRSAEGINDGPSQFDQHPGVLHLNMTNPVIDPTIIRLDPVNSGIQIP